MQYLTVSYLKICDRFFSLFNEDEKMESEKRNGLSDEIKAMKGIKNKKALKKIIFNIIQPRVPGHKTLGKIFDKFIMVLVLFSLVNVYVGTCNLSPDG